MDPLADYPAEIIERAGRSIWRPFRNWVDLADCTQEAWLCYFTYREQFDQQLQDPRGHWYVSRTLRRWVADYCRRQKAAASGYLAQDEYFYSRRRTRMLLEFFLCGEQLPRPGIVAEGTRTKARTDGTDDLTELLDVRRAWDRLDIASQRALWAAYGPEGQNPDPEPDAILERQQARRALTRLLDLLNGAT